MSADTDTVRKKASSTRSSQSIFPPTEGLLLCNAALTAQTALCVSIRQR